MHASAVCRYFIEYFATDLLMTPDGECVGVIAVCMEVIGDEGEGCASTVSLEISGAWHCFGPLRFVRHVPSHTELC